MIPLVVAFILMGVLLTLFDARIGAALAVAGGTTIVLIFFSAIYSHLKARRHSLRRAQLTFTQNNLVILAIVIIAASTLTLLAQYHF